MSLRVSKVARLAGERVVIINHSMGGELSAILTNFEAVDEIDQSLWWTLSLVIGEGPSAREVAVALNQFVSRTDYDKSFQTPILLGSGSSQLSIKSVRIFGLFRGSFYMPARNLISEAEREEFILRVKRAVYRDEEELAGLRSYVSNIEAAIQYRKTGPVRDPIPDDVKLLVWTRDGGACVRCAAQKDLQFDHVIPVAKGGGNTAANLQLLCEPCNLRKSDKIAF